MVPCIVAPSKNFIEIHLDTMPVLSIKFENDVITQVSFLQQLLLLFISVRQFLLYVLIFHAAIKTLNSI